MLKNKHFVYGPDDLYVPVKLNLGEFMIQKFMEHKDKTAIINGETNETTTFSQIAQDAVSVALSLTRLGVKKGETVAICSENNQDFLSAVLGVVCTGAAITTINTSYSDGEFSHIMNITKPRYIFFSMNIYKIRAKKLSAFKYIKKIILFGSEAAAGAVSWRDLAQPAPAAACAQFEAAAVAGQQDAACVLYSSGTTGLPKGVVLTHLNLLSYMCLPTQDGYNKCLAIAPWYHTLGLIGLMRYLCLGWTMVYLPKFDMKLFLDAIERHRVTQLIVVPPILVAMSKLNFKQDVSSVLRVFCGAAPLHRETLDEFTKKFPNVEGVFQGYGMTETTHGVIKDTADPTTAKPGGVGRVVSGHTIKIVDVETRKVLGPNEPGEICVRGPLVTKGYIGRDRKEDFDEEGFLKTGDIGYYDEDKYFFIVDRLKELIKYKGYQVAPAEIEALLLQHEAVSDAGVVGIEDKLAGEVPMAFIVTKQGTNVTEKELQEFVAKHLSNPKHLRGGVRFVTEIPKNPTGKILRRHLRALAKKPKNKL